MSSKEKLLASAQKNLDKGQIAKAIKDYQQVVDLDPKDIRNRQKLAELFCRAKLNAEALAEYSAVARYYADNGFYLKAIAVYKQMQKLDPEQVNVCHRLAELNVKQGLVGNALAEYRNLVSFFEKKKLLSDAIGVLQKMAELEPENLNLHLKIAECSAQAGLRDKAREEFTLVLGLLRDAREFSRIAKLYDVFLPFFSNDPEMNAGLAEALIRNGEIDKGLQRLKALLRDNPENSHILKTLAFGYRENEDFENERLTYQHLLKQAPGDLELREGYIQACLDGGEHRRALEELEEWKEAFFDAGKAPELRVFYEGLLAALPGDKQVQRALSLAYEEAGEEGKLLDSPAVREPLGEPEPAAEVEGIGTGAEELKEPAAVESVAPALVEPASCAEQIEPEEETAGAEEIPLEFLEAAAELGQPFSETPPDGETGARERVGTEQEMAAEEMELELELELDEPATELDGPFGGGAPPGVEEIPEAADLEAECEEFESAGIVEDLLEELEPEDLLEELEPLSHPEPLVPPAAGAREAESGSLGQELRELLSGLDGASGPARNVRDELEEAEFYLQQGLLDDAERVCRQLLAFDPGCEEAGTKLAGLAALRQEAASAPGDYEISGQPGAMLDGKGRRSPGVTAGQEEADRFGLDGLFDAFKIGVETEVDVEDTETHYNLGIAYKEMGLLDDAVAEFDRAMQNPSRLVDSLTLKGTCLFEKGAFDLAEEVFKSGLVYPGLSPAERLSLHYEMGLLYEAWGRPLEALESFQSAADADLFFRHVGEKVAALRKMLGLEADNGKEDPGAKGNKSRVSYI